MPSATTVLAVVQLIHLKTFRLSMVGLHVLLWYYVEDKTSQHPRILVEQTDIIIVHSHIIESLF